MAARHAPDVIVLDWMMPDLSGMDVLKRLRENRATKRIPVLMLTAKRMMREIEEAFIIGATGYMTKPISLGRLSDKVKNAMYEDCVDG